jgi:transposase InsO family protein
MIIQLIVDAIKNGCRKAVACGDIGICHKTLGRWEKDPEDKRRGPLSEPRNKLSEEEKNEMIKVANSKDLMDRPPCKIVPYLADQSRYIASESSFYRVLKERNLINHRGPTQERKHEKPNALVATRPNMIYSWDSTYLKTEVDGQFLYLYLFMDVFSRKIVGFEVHREESQEHSSELLKKICIEEKVLPHQLILHADNGGAMKGATMLSTMQRLGVMPSFSRPRVSNDNPYSEALFRTLKYCPFHPSKRFETIEEAREWVSEFAEWYNGEHLHSGISFVTPNDRHSGKDKDVLKKRKLVYQQAMEANPIRFPNGIKNFDWIDEVGLNNFTTKKKETTKKAS